MPKTKKLSYAKRRERRNEAKRCLRNHDVNNNGSSKSNEAIDQNLCQVVEILDDGDVQKDVHHVVRRNQEKIRNCILNVQQELDDACIQAFLNVLGQNTSFEPQDPLFYQGTHWYRRVDAEKDIQILYDGDIGGNVIGHWTCIYYDGSVVHVYDSLQRKLSMRQEEILKCLYQEYTIEYENVQRQPDGVSCGVFACAIAVSLAQGTDPTTICYFVDNDRQCKTTLTMRRHLCKILDEETLIQFPIGITPEQGLHGSSISKKKSNGIKSALHPVKTYASVCRTVAQQASFVTQVTSNDCNSADTIEKKVDPKKQWWDGCKGAINKKRRADYNSTKQTQNDIAILAVDEQQQCDDQQEKYQSRQAQKRKNYEMNAEKIKSKKRAKYAADPNNQKTKAKAKYAKNPDIKKAYENRKYTINSEVRKTYERAKYATAPETKISLVKEQYARNPKIRLEYEKTKYIANPEMKREYERNKYCANPKIKNKLNKKNNRARKERKAIRLRIIKTKSIVKKYKRLSKRDNTITLLGSVEKYIKLLTSRISRKPYSPQSRIEAERIVKWCVQARKGLANNVSKTLINLKGRVEKCLIEAAEPLDFESRVTAFCGESKHTGSTEAYYTDTTYNELNRTENELLVATTKGQVVNILPIIESAHIRKAWICSKICVIPDSDIINRLENLFQSITLWKMKNIRNNVKQVNKCSVNKSNHRLGHLQGCYTDPTNCKSKLLPLQILQSHFPQIRYFVRQIYEIIRLIERINFIDNALMRGDLKLLEQIANETIQTTGSQQSGQEEINLNEDELIAKHPQAFEELAKRSIDIPETPCLSCEKLCYRRDVSNIKKLRKPLTGQHWLELQQYNDNLGCGTNFICHYCLDRFRKNQLPPTCILNQLEVKESPNIISTLNDYERILIQRAKAFQTVHRMGTVSKKNLPHKHRVQKVKGRTFHLPLPLEETFKKLPSPTDALNLNQELFVMICGIPNKTKVVWSNLVDVTKVYDALVWLKQNNSLYSEISLPAEPELLLESLTQEVEFQIEPQQSISNENDSIDVPVEIGEEKSIERKAILTQIIDTNDYREQYTIYPINPGRENKSATALYQMLKVQEPALNTWDKYLDVMCFPDLYPYGNNGQREDGTVGLRECDFIKCKLMSKHSTFRLNQQYLFFLLHDSNIRQLKSGIFHKMNIIHPKEKLCAETYLKLMSEEQLEQNLTTIFARLRNTDQYWRKPRSMLSCMVHHYGPATWFLTLSPSEWMWTDLAEYIRRVNGPEMAHMSTSELVASDPVSASRYIDNKFQAMLKFISSSDNPIGEITHYFWRREYQGRGTQHFHMLVWIKDAPVIGESSTEDITRFINKYVTCKIPDRNVSPTLHRRVTTYQRHTHNDYCLRNKKNKTGFSRVCRFGFPRPITESLIMRDVAVSIAGRKQLKSKSRLYDLPRSDQETFINDYNPVVLTAWEGNMDLQFIGDKSTILNWYCTKYTTKTESSTSVEMFDEINSTKTLASRLWSVTTRSLDNRDCGALEAADTLLGISLYGTDSKTTIKWLDVNQVRGKRVKPHSVVTELHPRSTDIFYPSIVDDHYPNRPEELESLALYDFAKWYEVTKIRPISNDVEVYEFGYNLYLKKRKHACLVNHYKHNVNVEPEKYFHALLLLFKPWRDTDELKNNCDTFAEAFETIKANLSEAMQYHERLSDIQKGFEHVKELIEKKVDDLSHRMSNLSQISEDNNKDNPLEFQPVEANLAMREFVDVDEQIVEVNVDELIAKLNNDQKRIFEQVTTTLNNSNNTTEILRLFVSGAGGTGKSFLIKTIRSWTKQIMGKTTAVTAPTGLAAFNIDGLTVHRLFQLPIEHGGTPKYKELSDEVLKILRAELKDVVLFIIDEISMISNITLIYIHLRLCEIFDSHDSVDGWFGGKHILVMGDLLQLPPVNESSAFIHLSKSKIQKYLGSVGSINLWSHLFAYDELLINVRQQNDSTYLNILSSIRFGILTPNDQHILESRKIELSGMSVNERLEELCRYITKLPLDTVCLFATRHQCEILNTAMLAKIPGEEIELRAEDSIDCIPYLKKKITKLLNQENENDSRTAGLAKSIIIKIGAKIMVRRNIDVSLGLVNGTIGHVISVTRTLDTGRIESLKITLASGAEHTIEMVSTKFEIMNGAFIFRKQFPISLSYGLTIHKSQGLTLYSAVMDIGNSLFTCGQAYVALSRVTSLEGLHLVNLDPHSCKVQESALIEYNRLRKLYRPDIAEITISRSRNKKTKDTVWSIPLHVQNIQSEDNSNTLHDSVTTVIGIENVDGVSCYANASLQAIHHCKSIVRELIKLNNNDALEVFAYSYVMRGKPLDSLSVRELAGEQFVEKQQQDAAEFITALCRKSNAFRAAIEHELITITRCNQCGHSSKMVQPNYILAIPVTFAPDISFPKNLQDLLSVSLARWIKIDGSCENCHDNNRMQKTIVSTVKDIILVQLMLFSYENNNVAKISDFKINAIPSTKVTIDNAKFKVTSTIFHHGSNLNSGHYTTMLRDKTNNWLNVSDMNVRKMIWPRGAKEAYIFLLEKLT